MKIALIGNPNSGKTSIFNQLTGLNQQVGNYPGITVDKKSGSYTSENGETVKVLDLPGTYSFYPRSFDEAVVLQVLSEVTHHDYPDLVVVIVDATNLERNLLLFTQLYDAGLPVLMALNMTDVAHQLSIEIDHKKLGELFGQVEVIPVNARTGAGITALKKAITSFELSSNKSFINASEFDGNHTEKATALQQELTEKRFKQIRQRLSFCVKTNDEKKKIKERQLVFDKFVTHPVFGYLFFLGILFLIFQAIFAWAEWPMDLIDSVFLTLSQWTKSLLPPGLLTNLLAEGIIPGLGGVLIFIPQISLLFAFIFILEETGYMARVVFMVDRLMRPFGLNGRSIVPLISGVACAIPAVMATRTIENWKERIITIMVTPLMSCSARLPVYTLLIAIVIPDQNLGPFNLKGLVLMGLYLLGLIAALASASLFSFIIKKRQRGFLVMELPMYKSPRWKNLFITLYEKVGIFVFEAGKVIMAISVILWVLASYGPGDRIEKAVAEIPVPIVTEELPAYEHQVAAVSLSNSYIGTLGHFIEPAIKPLGYNWQIGIALITSFAAREVFVGSMATIYSIGEDFEEDLTLIERMRAEINPVTQQAVYTLASGLSLMIFYAFAMQCMSTIAVVRRETKSWKWPLVQLFYMTSMAYLFSWIAFQWLNA